MPAQKSRFSLTKAYGNPNKTLETAGTTAAWTELVDILSDPQLAKNDGNHRYFGPWSLDISPLKGDPQSPLGYLLDIHLSNSPKKVKRDGKNLGIKHQFQLVGRKDRSGQLIWTGINFTEQSGQQVFVPRMPEMKLDALAEHLIKILQAEDGFSIEKGALQFDAHQIDFLNTGIRNQIIRAYGHNKFLVNPLSFCAQSERDQKHMIDPMPEMFLPKFQVPEIRTATRRRVHDVATENDSFGKEQWRATLEKNFRTAFPQGADSFGPERGLVLCFPGAGGKEADLWLKQGFQEEDLVLIEENQQIAGLLREKYPRANVCQLRVGTRDKSPLKMLLKEHSVPNRPFTVLSFDPEGALTSFFLNDIESMFWSNVPEVFLSANFNLKREGERAIRLYNKIFSALDINPSPIACHEVRQQVMKLLPLYLTKQSPAYINQTRWHGNYEGDSDATRMYWTMAKLTRINGKS